MARKLVVVFLMLAVAAAAGLNILSRKAPGILRSAIERTLNKKVLIGPIEYRFPNAFELQGFEIQEEAPFGGETSFLVSRVDLVLSPLSFSKKALVIDQIRVDNATVVIRKYRGKLRHALSGVMGSPGPAAAGAPGQPAPGAARTGGLPLEIREFVLKDSVFKYADYDVDDRGFVTALDKIHGEIHNISIPFSEKPTRYSLDARLPQGRDELPGELRAKGWTQGSSLDTDANLQVNGVFLPYFRPYYAQVTGAVIEHGSMDSRTNLRIQDSQLTLNVDFEVSRLHFASYEEGDQLFGLKAEEILSFLKDSAGKLRFQFTARWNIADRSVKTRDVIRKSIERSLKNTVLSNVGNILQNTLQKIGEQGVEKSKDDLEAKIKKVKEFFKY